MIKCYKLFWSLIIFCSLHPLIGKSQNDTLFKEQWKQIDSLLLKSNQPKTALQQVNKLYQQAHLHHIVDQSVKALYYKYVLDKQVTDLDELENTRIIDQALDNPINDLERSLLWFMKTCMYANYFNRFSYRIQSRKDTFSYKDEDWATWTTTDFQWKIYYAFQQVLKDSMALQKAPIIKYPAIVNMGKLNGLRPTLYDLVVNSALDFYKNFREYIVEDQHRFELKDVAVLKPMPFFVQYDPQTADSLSNMRNVLLLYQRLLRFQIRQGNLDALVDIDNQRIAWFYAHLNNVANADKDSAYLTSLNFLIYAYPKNPQTLQSVYFIANFYNTLAERFKRGTNDSIYKDKRLTALSYINRYLPKDTVSCNGWYNLMLLKDGITKPKVDEVTMESINIPNEPILALLRFYHLPKIYVKVIALPNQSYSSIKMNDSLVNHGKITQQYSIEIPKCSDYQSYTTEIKLERLPVGYYMICLSADEDGKESRTYITFQVSNLAYMNNGGDYFVLNRKTGMPIEGVMFELGKKNKNDLVDVSSSQLTSDKDGHIIVKRKKENNNKYYASAYLYKANDTLFLNDYAMRPYVVKNTNPLEVKMDELQLESVRLDNMKVLYFTDRNIYRPGQSIHFKSVVCTKDGEDSSFHIYNRKDSIVFFLRDVNNKKLDSIRLKTDDLGSVSGTFYIPDNVLTGSFILGNQECRDKIKIQVEEYMRPTFFVEMNSLKGTFRLNDVVPITGIAKAYNGSKVSNASVKLHIERSARFPYYWLRSYYYSSGKNILDTTLQTDGQGKFTISFKAIPDESVDSTSLPVFQYEVSAEVTDKNGETRSKKTSVSVGYNSVDIQWNVNNKIKLLSFKDLKVYVKNNNGIAVALPVHIKIQPIEEPHYLLRQKYWEQPQFQIMDSLTYKQYFPHDIYNNEDQMEHWKKENPILEATILPDSLIQWSKKTESGWYYLEANIISPEGKELKDIRYVQLLPTGIPLTNGYLDGFNNNYTGYVGDTVRQYLSTACDEIYMTELTQNDKEESLFAKKILKKGSLPIVTLLETKLEEPLNRTFAGYKDNRFYQASFNINVIPKEEKLTVQVKTFRDRIEPGSKEKWSLLVWKGSVNANNVRLLSNMYDASLDQILKGNWDYSIRDNRYNYKSRSSFSISYDRMRNAYGFPQYGGTTIFMQYPQLTFKSENIRFGVGSLNEVVVVGYGVERKVSLTGAVASVPALHESASALLGKIAGLNVSTYSNIVLRGISSLNGKYPLYIVDGQILESGLTDISASDVESMTVLKDAEAIAIYGSQAANGAIIVTTKSKSYGKKINPPPLRSNFSETAFFYPSITPDKDGNYWVEFTMPDAVTQWRWRNLAMDKDLRFGYSEIMVTSQKTLMIQPNMPRFLRAGDHIVLTAKVSNTGKKDLDGKAFVKLLDADSNLLHWQKIDQTNFKVTADQSSTVAFQLDIPEYYSGPLYVKIWVDGGNFSDGELHEIPVLARKTLVTETLPFELKGDTTTQMRFSKLLGSDSSKTLQNKTLTIELATNPIWYAVQAIPYLQSFPYECSEQIFNRMYGGFLAEKIAHAYPKIKSVLEKWENDPEALKSNLQKNEELKQVFLEETPWLNNAESEALQKRNLAICFNKDTIDLLLQKNFDILTKRQLADGSFSWYGGDWGDRYITQNIVTQYLRLLSLNAVDKKWQKQWVPIIQKAKMYLASKIAEDYDHLKEWKLDLSKIQITSKQLMYLYALSFDTANHKYSTAENYYLNQSKTYWNRFSNMQKAWIAAIFYRKGEKSFAVNTVIRSLMENAVESRTNGTYWKSSFDWSFGNLSTVEMHSQIMYIINQIANRENNNVLKEKVEDMQHWLIRNKQTNYWSNTKATSDACCALLTANAKWLDAAPKVKIQLGDSLIHIGQEEAGTGYTKTSIPQSAIKSGMGKIAVDVSSNPGYVYGGIYWQYMENMDKVTETQSPMKLIKTIYKETISNGESRLQEVKTGNVLQVGDKLVVRLAIKVDRDMQYVHLKDLRPSNTEPEDAISGYQYKNNLGYYLSVKDVSSNFFLENIVKGTHILEYAMHVTHAGNFTSGLASIQCMYAPEINSHSDGGMLYTK